MKQGFKPVAAIVLTLGAVIGLSACDTGPECLRWTTHTHTTTTLINGKPHVSVTPVTVCVEYAEEPAPWPG